MEHDPEGQERLQAHKRRRDVELEVEVDRAPVARENEGDPAPLGRHDVEILVEAPVGSASAKRGSDAVADSQERARLRLRAEGKRGQKHDTQDVVETQAKTKARLVPRRGQKRESTPPLPDLEEEIENTTLTVPVVGGCAPIQGGSNSSTDVHVNSSVATCVSVEDMVQTSVPISTSVGIHGPVLVRSDRCVSMEARADTLRN